MASSNKPGLIRSFLILPGTALFFIPAALLWSSLGTPLAAQPANLDDIRFWLGLILLSTGLILAGWTVKLQLSVGQGTPAPWNPPTKLVIQGPYRCVRNPMITGAILILLAESLLSGSWLVGIWAVIFTLGNIIYLPVVEEKDLEKRFGEQFNQYKRAVPRWIPRLRPWQDPDENGGRNDSAQP